MTKYILLYIIYITYNIYIIYNTFIFNTNLNHIPQYGYCEFSAGILNDVLRLHNCQIVRSLTIQRAYSISGHKAAFVSCSSRGNLCDDVIEYVM